jgi:hypothetical protein
MEIEFSNATAPNAGNKPKNSATVASDSAIFQHLQHILSQLQAIPDVPNLQIRKVVAGNAEAVTLVFMPLELKDTHGLHSEWQAIVAHDSYGNKKLLSFQELPPKNEITFSEALMANGTLFEALSFLSPQIVRSVESS